jgi:tRNA(fMet)-specific endonuclease VapC
VKRLLDTNAYAALKRNYRPVVDVFRNSEEIVFSIVVVGELLFGFQGGARYARNVAELDEFLGNPYVSLQLVTRTTADRFGRIGAQLKKAGTPIPTNDLWIAAHAMETGAELVTLDRHFDRVAGLVVADLGRRT